MRVLGIAVDIPASRRPAVRAVLLSDSGDEAGPRPDGQVILVDSFEVPSVADDVATQLKELAEAVHGRVSSMKPDAIVVRRADRPPRASNEDGPRYRLLAEGAVTAVARMVVPETRILTGRDCGIRYGSKKADIDHDAAALVKRQLVPACAAALAALANDGR